MARTRQKTDPNMVAAQCKTGGRKSQQPKKSKKKTCLDLLTRPKGASLAELQKATGWQAHSVRGFLSGTVRKLPATDLETLTPDGAPRRYHVIASTTAA